MVVPFGPKNSLSGNAFAIYCYLPCMQYQNKTAVAYGCGAAMRILRQPPILKSQSTKILLILKPISDFESKGVDKDKSGNFMFLSTLISSS